MQSPRTAAVDLYWIPLGAGGHSVRFNGAAQRGRCDRDRALPDADEASRGAYEVRCWRGGSIPDVAEAVGGAHRLTTDSRAARRLLDAVARLPVPVWGRDELNAGDMWNSNSMIARVIATAGLSTADLRPPLHGRAPGWHAGLQAAARGGRPTPDGVRRPARWQHVGQG
ncbi:MAG TPA: hypothetical protein VHF51_05595 [Solirubrobacteraceae bacterium]|nr:hypothetical protein [Solirubrobacteraceae bacterium]